jgi:RNA polymerase sigma-70 factor (ECF subfamily)
MLRAVVNARGAENPSTCRLEQQVDESLLIAQAKAGNKAAFRQLFENHRQAVARVVFRMIGPRPELEDLVQDVFVQVFRSLDSFAGTARFSTWLHRVAVNVVLMFRRAEKSRPAFASDLVVPVEDFEAPNPGDDTERRERVRCFFEILEQIPEKKRTVFVLHDLEGMSPEEISEVVDAPILTVRTRLFYARRELEQLMKGHPVLGAILESEGGFSGDRGGSQ